MKKNNQQTFYLIGKEFETEKLLEVFKFETPYQIDRLKDYLSGLKDKRFKLVITPQSRPKTREALGLYFGALVRATAMDMLHLTYDPEKIPDDWQYYKKLGKVKQKHFDAADDTLRLEFHYNYTRMLDGKVVRVPKTLSDHDNAVLLQFIDRIMDYRIQNGFPYIDIEKYKQWRDSAITI